jgi:hypothetical protein
MIPTATGASGPSGGMISVLVPVWQEPEPLVELYREYAGPLRDRGWDFEFVFICEPGFERQIAELLAEQHRGEPIRILQVAQRVDESSLYNAAGLHATADLIVTLPAYRRIEADQLPILVDQVREGVDLVVARRWPRKDSWVNRAQNRMLHRLIHWLVGGNLHDVACGVRAMKKEVLLSTPVYGDSFRFFPLLAERAGFLTQEIDTPQHLRDRRTRIYSPTLYLRRFIDLLGIFVILRFTSRPLRFFGPIGATMMLMGLVALAAAIFRGLGSVGSLGRVILLTGLFLLVLGIQAMAIGLVGEMMVFLQAPTQSRYRIVERVN